MKVFRAKKGPFVEQPFYSATEVDNTCIDELTKLELLPKVPEAIRIERFIEKRFGISPRYEELPYGMMGYTCFGKSGVQEIVIDKSLDDGTPVNERRVRTTLAHEAGHGLLHAHLFVLTGQSSLLPDGMSDKPRVLCRDGHAGPTSGYRGEWWEVQANLVIGSLLLPRPLVTKAIQEFMVPSGGLGAMSLPTDRRNAAIARLSDVFNVNPAVARIRLEGILPEEVPGQQVL